MFDGPGGIDVFEDYFQVPTSGVDTSQTTTSSVLHPKVEFEVLTSFLFLNEWTCKSQLL